MTSMTVQTDPGKLVKQAMSEAAAEAGTSDVMFADDERLVLPGRLSTGSPVFDLTIGGGIPLGLITHIHGNPGSGRTTLAYHLVVEAQRDGGYAAFIDADRRFNEARARALGVDPKRLVVVRPRTAEKAFGAIARLAAKGIFRVIIVDTLASLTPRAEYNGDVGDSHSGLFDKTVDQGLRKVLDVLTDTATALVVFNQYRIDPGVMFGSGEYAPGGVDNFAALSIKLKKQENLRREINAPEVTGPTMPAMAPLVKAADDLAAIVEEAESEDSPPPATTSEPVYEEFGIVVRFVVTKNSHGKPHESGRVHLVFNEGISREGELVEMGLALGVLVNKGGKIYFGDIEMGRLQPGAAEFLRTNPDTACSVELANVEEMEKAAQALETLEQPQPA